MPLIVWWGNGRSSVQLIRRNIGNERLPSTIPPILIWEIVIIHLLLPIAKLDWR
jgi:hypothetical protein